VIQPLIADAENGLTLQESSAYRSARLDDAAVAAALRSLGEKPDFSRYHLLMALRRERPQAYADVPAERRAAILTAALAHARWLNDFGYLDPGGSFDDVAAQALLESGSVAMPALAQLLGDQRPAPLRGSEAATMSKLYGYRRCDYAYRYLSLVLGEQPEFPAAPDERDAMIARLRERVRTVGAPPASPGSG
jgi:hypothetical protein